MAKSLLVTGYAGEKHKTSYQDAIMHSDIVGKERYLSPALNKLATTILDANTIQIDTGGIYDQGRFILNERLATVSIANGAQGLKRRDLLVFRYERNEDTEVETATFRVIQGVPSAENPQTPGYIVGNLYNKAPIDEVPLCYIPIDGINVGAPVWLLKKQICFGDMTEFDKYICDKIYPPGKGIYISPDPTSPAALFGGTWTALPANRFLRFGTTFATGGADTHTHTSAAHTHSVPGHTHSVPAHAHNISGGFSAAPAATAWALISPGGSSIASRRQSKAFTRNHTGRWSSTGEDTNTTANTTPAVIVAGATNNSSALTSGSGGAGTSGSTTPGATGSSSNVPAYQAVYGWRRTA